MAARGMSPQDVGIKTWGTRRANGCKAPKSAPALDSQEQQRLAETRIQPPEVSPRAHAAPAKELPTVAQHEHVRSGAGSVDTEGSLSTDAPLELSRTLSGTRRRIKVRKRSWQRSGEKATAEADDSTRAQDSPGALKDAAASLLREELEDLRAAKHVLRARASKLEDRAAMLEDAGAQLRAELDELRQGHRNRRHHRSHGNDNDKDVASITMTVGEADIANLYAYCIETILRTSSLLSVGVHIFGLFALLTLQITCVTQPDERGAVLAGALTFVLPVFACRAGADAWGFYNASLVLHMLGYFPAYKDPVPTHFMYPTTTLELRHGINGDLTPLINLIVSITSLAVLALFMKNDDESCTAHLNLCSGAPQCASCTHSAGRLAVCLDAPGRSSRRLLSKWCCCPPPLPMRPRAPRRATASSHHGCFAECYVACCKSSRPLARSCCPCWPG